MNSVFLREVLNSLNVILPRDAFAQGRYNGSIDCFSILTQKSGEGSLTPHPDPT